MQKNALDLFTPNYYNIILALIKSLSFGVNDILFLHFVHSKQNIIVIHREQNDFFGTLFTLK